MYLYKNLVQTGVLQTLAQTYHMIEKIKGHYKIKITARHFDFDVQSNYLTSKSNTNAIFKSNINYQHFYHSSRVNQSKQVPAAVSRSIASSLAPQKIRILGLFYEK